MISRTLVVSAVLLGSIELSFTVGVSGLTDTAVQDGTVNEVTPGIGSVLVFVGKSSVAEFPGV